MAKRGGRLHQPTAAELAARAKKEAADKENRNSTKKLGGSCNVPNCKGGWIPYGKGQRRRCMDCNKPSAEPVATRKPKSKSSGVGVDPSSRWGSQ